MSLALDNIEYEQLGPLKLQTENVSQCVQVEQLSSNLVTFSSLEELHWARQQLVVPRSKWEEMVWVGASDLKGTPINDVSDNAASEYFYSNFVCSIGVRILSNICHSLFFLVCT